MDPVADRERPTLLVMASTFPRWEDDTEPRFVESLSFELADHFNVIVLAPHCRGAKRHELHRSGDRQLVVRRFRYCFSALENLAYDGGMLWRMKQNPLRMLLLPFFLLSQLLVTADLVRTRRVDAIHAHWIIPQGLVVALMRVFFRRSPPVLITSHGGDLYALRGRVLEGLKRWILGKADKVSVVSSAMRDYCEERGLVSGQIVVQSMGVDLESQFTPGDETRQREGLVFVGRLVEKKGVEYLIEAMSILMDDYPQLRLTIVGDGPLGESLRELALSCGVGDQIRFVGSVRSEEVATYLRSSAISVMPSVVASSGDQEGLGLVAVEAMGCGCAVVAFDLPAVRDTIIDGKTGLMAEPANAKDLAEKLGKLLSNDSLRRSLADAGRRYVLDKFAWPAAGSGYREVLSDMLHHAR